MAATFAPRLASILRDLLSRFGSLSVPASVTERLRPPWIRGGLGAVLSAMVLQIGLSSAAPSPLLQNGITSPASTFARGFGYPDVVLLARELATKPFDSHVPLLPESLTALNYDTYRDIRFRPDMALLKEGSGPFRLQLLHLGLIFKRAVSVNVIQDGRSNAVTYSGDYFNYGANKLEPPLPADLGYAGLRLHYPLNDPRVEDELISFLGASYFRFLGRHLRYGLSARGLSIGAGGPEPEEFPEFREFWVEQPAQQADHVVVYALLDSQSLAAAYKFTIVPGPETSVEVVTTLFPRKPVSRLGIAPLTSMFFFGENAPKPVDDFRPEVHDSDGLLVHSGKGEWLWRPLQNPKELRVTSYADNNPKGFGLFQRDRNFDHYEDLEAVYQLRPSYWIEPEGDWGAGSVELIEFNTLNESADNIVALWRPKEVLAPGQSLELRYRIIATTDGTDRHKLAHVASTFQTVARANESFVPVPPGSRRFLIDFVGGDLSYYQQQPADLAVEATTSSGRILRTFLTPNAETMGFRLAVDVELGVGQSTTLRATLKAGNNVVSETWTNIWQSTL